MAAEFGDNLKTFNQFLGKSDGKDKMCATIQYACLFLSAGKPGNIKKIQASVATARKVFRILKPLETLTPLLLTPGFDPSNSRIVQLINKVKAICMACYFGFDHIVWMGQVNLITSPKLLKTSQKISTSCWLAGSMCTIASQCLVLASTLTEMKDEQTLPNEKEKIRKQIQKHLTILIHACLQAALALGLLEFAPVKPRYLGLIGTLTSALNCYMLYPSTTPAPKEKDS